jgi:hypothetical protein
MKEICPYQIKKFEPKTANKAIASLGGNIFFTKPFFHVGKTIHSYFPFYTPVIPDFLQHVHRTYKGTGIARG